jgi:histidinol phosphatase-like PHP family hydrolase
MIDLHTHTFFSDGTLCPAELMQRAEEKGLTAVALTDHADPSNLEQLLDRITRGLQELNRYHRIRALAGVELTHVPPSLIAALAQRARDLGAEIVVVHGETIVEPVPQGTNMAALEAKVDVLAHPGLLTAEQAKLAAKNGVLLEISGRAGHCLGNGRVASMAREAGAKLVINSDAHASRDLIDVAMARKIGFGAGLSEKELAAALENAKMFVERTIHIRSCRTSP